MAVEKSFPPFIDLFLLNLVFPFAIQSVTETNYF